MRSTTRSWGRGLPAQAADGPDLLEVVDQGLVDVLALTRSRSRMASKRWRDWSMKRPRSSAVHSAVSGTAAAKMS